MIVTLSLLSFSLIFGPFLFYGASLFFETSLFLWPLSFSLFYFFIIPHLDNALENDDYHTSIYLQLNDYNSMLEQKMTPYEYLRRSTGICNEPRVTCMKELWTVALPQIQCHLHDHAKQYDNDGACHSKRNGGKLHGNVSRNGYGNAIIGRYGGYFEEDIRRFMCERAYHITGFGCTGEVCTNSQCEKGQCTVPKRLARMEGWECV